VNWSRQWWKRSPGITSGTPFANNDGGRKSEADDESVIVKGHHADTRAVTDHAICFETLAMKARRSLGVAGLRASTSLKPCHTKDVDGRDEPGHDDVDGSRPMAVGIRPHPEEAAKGAARMRAR